ncbi:MAG: hypothetical protein KAQ62_16935, partial [Cyclobacteriaceae bacterium]|nr:hypothetical protein [Cyclobacteriaceae bacterium]
MRFKRCIRHILLLSIILVISFPSFAATITWIGGTDLNWSTAANWSSGTVPGLVVGLTDDITIDCSCTVTASTDIYIDGTLTIASGTTLNMGGFRLIIGEAANASAKTATVTNNGTIENSAEIKVKGDKFPSLPKNGTYVGDGPYLINSGTIDAVKFSVGNNNGGGKLTNTVAGLITSSGAWHVDGSICNSGVITLDPGTTFLLHGGVLTCGGTLKADDIELSPNPEIGAAGAGNVAVVEDQAFLNSAGDCTSASDALPLYTVIGGTGCTGDPCKNGGPNLDDTYTYQQLLDEFGVADDNVPPQFTVDANLVSSCGEEPLPIELLYFSAEQGEDSKVNIEWATASETDNDYFIVERSVNGMDWEELFQVSGAGNSNIVLNYSTWDNNPYKGI